MNCNPDGKRKPMNDKDCKASINHDGAGYCECKNGSKKMKKGCRPGLHETCFDACYDGRYISILTILFT